ncbi:DUF2570 family protein [Providencia rettgeri]|uniref:DUF2570 family protein n=1 Tax=Providencia rettgeri TaxID=587 RepID=UPI0019819255|nr:DUF2570 family protein [Providencia rettgeri]MBN6350402.1 DUF2570 family protein [Providencia rettgeri]
MSYSEKWLIAIIAALGFTYWLAMDKVSNLSKENQSLNDKLSQQSLISDNAYTSISIFDRISGATIDAKQQNTLDAQGTKKDVKTILVDNDCSPVAAPDGLINRMRQYKD